MDELEDLGLGVISREDLDDMTRSSHSWEFATYRDELTAEREPGFVIGRVHADAWAPRPQW